MNEKELSPDTWYANGYRKCYYTGILGAAYGLVHKLMESPYSAKFTFPVVLEVGSGNGEHFKFVRHKFQRYFMSDIIPVQLEQNMVHPNVEILTLDCEDLTRFESKSIDRLIATCLLVHLNDMKKSLMEWKRVMKKGGIVTIYVAPEPGILLILVRKLFIWPKAKKNGMKNPELFAFQEHKNHYPGMRALIDDVFQNDKITRKRFPFTKLPWQLSLFEILQIEINE
jgi:phosphatidylethanolamine/phosphatidyl-N-methylethanolamine N-methyltransferase